MKKNTQVSQSYWVHWSNGGTRLLCKVTLDMSQISDDDFLLIHRFTQYYHFRSQMKKLKHRHRWPSKLALMPKHCLKGPSVDVLWVHKSARFCNIMAWKYENLANLWLSGQSGKSPKIGQWTVLFTLNCIILVHIISSTLNVQYFHFGISSVLIREV